MRKLPYKPIGAGGNIRDKANWLKHGGGSFSIGELAAIAAGRSPEAYTHTFRLRRDDVPVAIRQAAKSRLKDQFIEMDWPKAKVRIALEGYWSPQMIAPFLKAYRRTSR